jgi:hypothetical protein
MRIFKFCRAAATVATIAVLSACGGGGGGGGGGFFLPPGAGLGSVTLSGVATYDSISNASGPLVYTAIASKPVRGATVEIVNAVSSVLATATTDANGAYSVSVPSGTDLLVRVRAQMTQGGGGATWDVTVRDNTQSDAIYSMETPLFNSGVAALSRDIHAPSGWGGSGYSSTRVAAPFAVLDTVYAAQAKVLSVAASTAFPPLRVFWSINNLPASGDRAQGQIGTTSFVSGGSGSRAIYVLGKENVDTDEYDSSVVAHEWGHYYQSAFSRDDSPGGNHSISQFVDRRLAFSEGWGNAWSGIALERSNYTDSIGSGQAQGTNLDLTVGPSSGAGWFRESSVQSILWQLNKQVGFKPIHDTLTGGFKSAIAVTSIHPFAATYRVASPSSAGLLDSLLTGQAISAAANDPFGTNESNNGGLGIALPMYGNATVGGGTTTACVSNQYGNANKHGSYTYLRFSASSTRGYAFTVTGPAGSDPDFVIYSGGERARSDGLGTTESATISLTAGDYVLVINDFENISNNTCFTVSIT